ncbi:glycosyltransferase family A protein [Gemmatimonas sp.]|uniref:glycosyltransferase family 2 protein n=1 Tax=Gemmatimonas sp. TaxID=1962908 RepID=UPI0025C1A24E|nr:glycosyltransferase family A protein [Gemmatimonas sp.]MCA2991437.1 glycosyltransferase family 2 protein [Gemmatimonas sp.]
MSEHIAVYSSTAQGAWQDTGVVFATASDLAGCWSALVERNRDATLLLWKADEEPVPTVPEVCSLMRRAGAEVLHGGGNMEYASAMPCLRTVHPAYIPLARSAMAEFLSSPELSVQRCAIAPGVLAWAAPPCKQFVSMGGLEFALGWEWLQGGVIVRSARAWRSATVYGGPCSFADQLHFMFRFFGSLWTAYAALRLVMAGARLATVTEAWRAARGHRCRPQAIRLRRFVEREPLPLESVAVLIPTIDRVPYLRSTLDYLRHQTHRPVSIVVVDQTPEESRDHQLERDFADLPLRLIRLEKAGQSSARNAGLQKIDAAWTLLIDDDVDLPPTLIAQHLALCAALGADASVGVAVEEGVPALPEPLRGYRVSPVLNGNNSLVRTATIKGVGGFDLAYDGGSRADGDLGVRMQKAGALMVLDGSNSLFHHHAPRGGLRVHKARVVTRATARARILGRHPVVPTELYLSVRHFGEWSAREVRLIRLWSGLRMDGGRLAKLARLTVGMLRLPFEWRRQSAVELKARELLQQHPTLDRFDLQA